MCEAEILQMKASVTAAVQWAERIMRRIDGAFPR